MYEQNSFFVVGVLFALILVAYEAGFRIGRYFQRQTDTEIKQQTGTIQAGVLGLLALLLGFTFNMALQRFDNRSHAVIKEANTIGTALLRTKLLPAPYDSTAATLLKRYVGLRIELSGVDLTVREERRRIDALTNEVQNALWDNSIAAATIDPRPVTTGYYIIALNDMIDARGERNAILKRHIPEIILFLLFFIFIVSGAIMGYASGLGLARAYIPMVLMTILIVLVVFIIIDLDRPARGIITVKQDSMMDLLDTETVRGRSR